MHRGSAWAFVYSSWSRKSRKTNDYFSVCAPHKTACGSMQYDAEEISCVRTFWQLIQSVHHRLPVKCIELRLALNTALTKGNSWTNGWISRLLSCVPRSLDSLLGVCLYCKVSTDSKCMDDFVLGFGLNARDFMLTSLQSSLPWKLPVWV